MNTVIYSTVRTCILLYLLLVYMHCNSTSHINHINCKNENVWARSNTNEGCPYVLVCTRTAQYLSLEVVIHLYYIVRMHAYKQYERSTRWVQPCSHTISGYSCGQVGRSIRITTHFCSFCFIYATYVESMVLKHTVSNIIICEYVTMINPIFQTQLIDQSIVSSCIRSCKNGNVQERARAR